MMINWFFLKIHAKIGPGLNGPPIKDVANIVQGHLHFQMFIWYVIMMADGPL